MRLRTDDPVDGLGKIRPVRDTDYVGQPVVAHIVESPCGFYVFHGDQCVHRDSHTEAMGYVERLRN